jgi:hypothetical protein
MIARGGCDGCLNNCKSFLAKYDKEARSWQLFLASHRGCNHIAAISVYINIPYDGHF